MLKSCSSEGLWELDWRKKIFWPSLCCFFCSFDFIPVWCSRRFRHKSAFTVVPVLRLSVCADEAVIGWDTGHRTPAVGDTEVWILCYCTDRDSSSICTLLWLFIFLTTFYFLLFLPTLRHKYLYFYASYFHNRLISLVLMHCRLFKRLHPKC